MDISLGVEQTNTPFILTCFKDWNYSSRWESFPIEKKPHFKNEIHMAMTWKSEGWHFVTIQKI